MAPHADADDDLPAGAVRLPAPPRPPFSASPPRLVIIGAGNRGKAYATAIQESSNGVLVGVVEPLAAVRAAFGRRFLWGPKSSPTDGQEFADWPDYVAWELQRRVREEKGEPNVPEGADAVFVCVQDQMHKEVVLGLAPLGLHIMCEKPLAPSLADCLAIYRSVQPDPAARQMRLFSIGHVLRYSPHNMLLRKLLLEDRVVGDVMAVNHTEPVGWYHFTHSYVRGNWRNASTSAPSLLAKSCHDMDILYWLLAAPAAPGSSTPPHVPADVSSAGHLQLFRRERKPAAAGAATNCLACAHEPACQFSAKRIYTSPDLAGRQQTHFASIVAPGDIEDGPVAPAQQPGHGKLLERLAEDWTPQTPREEVRLKNWYGRCVFESDNDVNDNQTVTLSWEPDPIDGKIEGRGAKTATLHMVAFTEKICQRFSHIYGVHGEVYADSSSIVVTDFRTGAKKTYFPYVPPEGGHGDGDAGLTRQFVLAVDRVKNHGQDVEEAQREHIGCGFRDIIMSHGLVFAAEEARLGRKVVGFREWWETEVGGSL